MVYGDNPDACAEHGVDQDAQGARLPEVRQPVARRAAQDEQRAVLGDEAAVRGEVRGDVRQLRRGGARPTLPGSRPSSKPTSRPSWRCCTRTRRWSTTWPTGWCSWATASRRRSRASGCKRRAIPWKDERLFDFARYPEDLYAKPGTSIANRAALAKWGAWINAFGGEGVRPAAVHRRLGRPGRLDQHQRLCCRLRRLQGLRLVRALRDAGRRAAAAGDHRVRQCRHPGGHGDGQLLQGSGEGVRRVLGRLLDLRLVLVPEVRHDAPVQPAGAGLRSEGGQGDVRRRALGAGDGRRQPHALRHLRAVGDAALPARPHPQPAPVGVQRGAGAPGGGFRQPASRSSCCT